MPAQTLDLIDGRIIEQGAYWSLTLSLVGDLDNASLRGQIKTGYGGELLAEFRYGAFEYDEEYNRTIMPIFLNAAQTQKIPVPSGELWVYDIKMSVPGQDSIRLLQGNVNVSPGVTDV